VCTEQDALILEPRTKPDHVQLLDTVDPPYGIHRLVEQIQGLQLPTATPGVPHAPEPPPDLVDQQLLVAAGGDPTSEDVKRSGEN
jgi:hypothetical protein